MNKYLSIFVYLAASLVGQEGISLSLNDVAVDGSMADRRLLALVKKQQSLLERVSQTADDEGNVDPAMHRQLHELSQEWLSFITDNPKDIEARILYGKFLNTFGQRESAVEQFIAVDRLDNNLHVVKQQIGNYMAENGLYAEALHWFLQATTLAPEEPRYHFQMGELLYRFRWQFLDEEAFTRKDLDRKIKTAFYEAAQLMPESFAVNLRYGESFYDLETPVWDEALDAFKAVMPLASSEAEVQTVHLHLARVHSHLGNREASTGHLSHVSLPVFESVKAQVEASLGQSK